MNQEVVATTSSLHQPKKTIEIVDASAINDIETEASILSKQFYQLTLEINETSFKPNISHKRLLYSNL